MALPLSKTVRRILHLSVTFGGDQGCVRARGGVKTKEEAFSAFFTTEYPKVVRSIELMTGDRGVAEDVSQEAFAEAFTRWDRISQYDRPGAWVRRVAIRRSARRRRRRNMEPKMIAAQHDPLIDDGIVLREAILRLPHGHRAVVVLYYYEERTVTQIATLLGKPEATVKVHLHRARQRLAVILGEEEIDDVTR